MIVAAQFNDTSTSSGQAKARSNFGRVVIAPFNPTPALSTG